MIAARGAADWEPERYRRFEDERTRPAADLLARVGASAVGLAVDLGCGPGNSTELLLRRFPRATVVGVDTSPAMLSEARRRRPQATFIEADIAGWSPPAAPDLVFANAALQWVPNHASLIPRLFAALAPGGWLAVQVPDNLDEPSHRAMREVADAGPWRDRLAGAARVRAGIVLSPEAYYDLLCLEAAAVDVWRTAYHHSLPSAAAIVDLFRSTGLRPFLEQLDGEEQGAFLAAYADALAHAYPVRRDGCRLLRFPRLFIVARRQGDPSLERPRS